MEGNGREDIRSLLKTFGIKADEVVIAHLARNPGGIPLQIRLILEDQTDTLTMHPRPRSISRSRVRSGAEGWHKYQPR